LTRIQKEFPDCEAMRLVEEDRWQRVLIEFEYESRNFVRHMHGANGCDLIVCWKYNWPEADPPLKRRATANRSAGAGLDKARD
jgi:hypothetical protein